MKALITGVRGQDGSYLSSLLKSRGYEVLGLGRPTSGVTRSPQEIEDIIKNYGPDEAYFLAAHHASSQNVGPIASSAPNDMNLYHQVNAIEPTLYLNAIARHAPKCHSFVAGSCHIYGEPSEIPQTELTPMNPTTPYGRSKLEMLKSIRELRLKYGLKISFGILFNHESPKRGAGFITTRVTSAAARAKKGLDGNLKVGALSAKVDWGYAPEYCEGMALLTSKGADSEYVFATGQAKSVQELAETAFRHVGRDWREFIEEDPSVVTRRSALPYLGNPAKIEREYGWKAKMRFEAWVHEMVDFQLETLDG